MPSFVPKVATRALILLHGYGSNGEDMLNLAQELNLENTAYICPDASEPLPWGGYAWFPLYDFDMNNLTDAYTEQLTKQAMTIVPFVQKISRELTEKYKISPECQILGGFSQGGLIALLAGMLIPKIQTVIGMSAVPICVKGIEIQNKPEVILTHGVEDFVVPIDAFSYGVAQFKKLNINAQTHIETHLAHGVNGGIIAYLKNKIG